MSEFTNSNTPNYDDKLFLAQLLTGFLTLFCLREMTYPDDPKLHDPQKVTKHNSIHVSEDAFQMFLPVHKVDRFFEGNIVIIWKNHQVFNPHKHFITYLQACNRKFPFNSLLSLTSKGVIPTRSFFTKCLQCFFNSDTAGQSLRAGGATSLAKNDVPPSIIQAIGRWASNGFKIYIQRNPVLIQALLFGQTACSAPTYIHALDAWLLYRFFLPYYLQTFYLLTDFSRPQQMFLLHPYVRHEHSPATWMSSHNMHVPSFALAPHITHYVSSSQSYLLFPYFLI